MTVADITTSSISAALKDWYLDGVRTQINEEADPLWAELRKTTDMVAGDNIVASLRYGRVGGVGARGETDNLPTPNPRKSLKATFDTKNVYGRMRIYEKAIRVSANQRGSFISQLDQALEDLLTDAKDYVEWQVYGGGTGKIATITNVNSTVWTLDTVVGLFEGMLIDAIDDADDATVVADGVEITDVDFDNNKITVSSAGTAAANDYLVRDGALNNEMTGLAKIFTADNTVWNINRAAYSFFNPTILTVSGEIDEVTIQEGLDKGFIRSGAQCDFLIGPHAVRRAWQNYMTAFRQTVNTVQLKGGFSAPVYDNNGRQLPFIAAKYAPKETLYALSRAHMSVPWLGDWDWGDRDGAILHRVTDKAAYEAFLQLYAEIFCDLPRGMVKWTSITEH